MGKLFGTDGIRGVANRYPMDAATALKAGQAIAAYFKKDATTAASHIVIGQDTRLSGDMLASAVAAGACSAGVHVRLSGVLPTPAIARQACTTGAIAGVVISASHNPFEDNGIKVFDGNGYKLPDTAEAQIEALILGDGPEQPEENNAIGRVSVIHDAGEQYIAFLKAAVDVKPLNSMTIAVDCANGATYSVAPALFRQMGATVIPMFCEPDGININDRCGSQHPGTLSKSVSSHKADVGFAFDGDGDRLIAVDETGAILSGDQIMAVCARDLLDRGELKNRAVVSTVMSNMGFRIALEQMGIQLFSTQVGDRYVMETMRREGAILGGEDSGHMIFRDVHSTGDGLMAALRLLKAMQASGARLSELARVMTVYPQVLVNVAVDQKPDIRTVPEIMNAIDDVEKKLGGEGRVLVRYSGTQNMCRVMVEGPDDDQTAELCDQIANVIKMAIGGGGRN